MYKRFFFAGFSSTLPSLKHYDTLHSSQLGHSIVKRGAKESSHPYNSIKELSFSALGKDFRLILKNYLTSWFLPDFLGYVACASNSHIFKSVLRKRSMNITHIVKKAGSGGRDLYLLACRRAIPFNIATRLLAPSPDSSDGSTSSQATQHTTLLRGLRCLRMVIQATMDSLR